MVYAGLINKNIVATLQKNGLNSIGFSGADANVIPAHKRPVKTVDFGWVGDVETEKLMPIFRKSNFRKYLSGFLCHYTRWKGNLLNTNADTIASSLAVALSSHFDINLAYCFEKNGVLENIEDENSVIAKIIPETYIQLKENNIVNDGMIPKIDNAFAAIEKGVKSVFIVKETFLKKLINENDRTSGTEITQ
jgi:acetylglutamate kinase